MKLSLDKMYPYVVALSMITCAVYLPHMGRLSVAYLLYLLYVCLHIVSGKMSRTYTRANMWFLCAFVLITLYDLLNNSVGAEIERTIVYTGKFVVWIFAFTFAIDANFDREKFLNLLANICIVSTFYLILQTFSFYILNIKIDNVMKLLFTVKSENVSQVSYYRPSSFFCEPAYCSTFLLSVLAPLLLTNIPCKHRKVATLAAILGIILSGSTSGLVLLVLLIIFREIKIFQLTKRFISLKEIFVLFVGLLLLFVFWNYETILSMFGDVGRMLLISINKLNRLESNARFGRSFEYLKNIDNSVLLFGVGIGNEYSVIGSTVYLNSITRIILQTGYVGLILFSVYTTQFLLKTKNLCSLFFILMFIVKSITGNATFAIAGLFIMIMYKIFNEY